MRWPGLPEVALTPGQLHAVRLLVAAWLYGDSPDVAADLGPLFAGSPAWGVLVVPGSTPGTWRVPDPCRAGETP